MKTKQVIVIRKDLKNSKGHKVRTGKIIAQAIHASQAFIFQNGSFYHDDLRSKEMFHANIADVETISWLRDGFKTEISLGVNSEEELMAVYDKAKEAGLRVHLIEDAGLTEFDGVKTKTCLAIGPHESSKIDKITSNLQMY
jgi:peptidyl-tRNA hydrolase, PTH2 family